MRTHVPVPAKTNHKQGQAVQQPAQLLAEPQAAFEDNRPQTAQLKTQQAMMSKSPQLQKLQAMQVKMNISAHTERMQDMQARMAAGTIAQRVEEEEPLQGKFEGETAQREAAAEGPIPNNTGLPNQLKAGIESLSGMSMNHVKVHYNSSKPAQLQAHAYAQGSEIHVAAGQEQHLPHEAWHVVQQAQGRVKPTLQMKGGVPVNDDVGLESEADLMGGKALSVGAAQAKLKSNPMDSAVGVGSIVPAMVPVTKQAVAQRELDGDEEAGDRIKIWEDGEVVEVYLGKAWIKGDKHVTFFRKKQTNKSKDKPEKIDANLAFPLGTSNRLIEGEVGQTEEAHEALENSEYGPLNVPGEVVGYLMDLVLKNMKKYGLEVKPNPTRIKLMISSIETFAVMFAGKGASLKEFVEMIGDDEEYYLQLIMEEMQHTGVQVPTLGGEGSGGGGNDEWKTKQTEKLKGSLLHRIADKKHADIVSEDSTLHHKLSRSRFKRLLALLSETPPNQKGVSEMWEFISQIRSLTHTGDPETALENWAANIELGVLVNRRKPGDDPGENFDGNFPSGIATPRTIELQEVDLTIQSATAGTQVNWHEVAGRLSQTQKHHAVMTEKEGLHSGEFTTPHLGQWAKTSDGFVRDKPLKSVKSGKPGGLEKSKEESKEPLLKVESESGVSSKITHSVVEFLQQYHYNPGGPLLIVTGENWTCYIRCVLHHFGDIGRYGEVMKEVEKTVDISSGVVVGSAAEMKIIAAITKITGRSFHVLATDASHGQSAISAVQAGTVVRIVLTGAHFSLLM